MSELIDWWNSLEHNDKKVLLASYDFEQDETKIRTSRSLYDDYFTQFGFGVRKRLDSFETTEENIQKVLELESISFAFKPETINRLTELKILTVHGVVDFNLLTITELISLSCSGKFESLSGIENFQKLEKLQLTGCYYLTDFTCLLKLPNLQLLDFPFLLDYSVKPIAQRLMELPAYLDVQTMSIPRWWLHMKELDHSHYYPKRNEFKYAGYEFDTDEIEFIRSNADPIVYRNLENFILSGRYKIVDTERTGHGKWILEKIH